MFPFVVVLGLVALAIYKFEGDARAAAFPYAPSALAVMPLADDPRLRVRPADVPPGGAGNGMLYLEPLSADTVLGPVQVEVSFSGKSARVVGTPDTRLQPYVGQSYFIA